MDKLLQMMSPEERTIIKYARYLLSVGAIAAVLAAGNLLSGGKGISASDLLYGVASAFLVAVANALYSLRGAYVPPAPTSPADQPPVSPIPVPPAPPAPAAPAAPLETSSNDPQVPQNG